jgi:hypothetical protein
MCFKRYWKEVKLKFDLKNTKTIYNPFDFSRTNISKDTAITVDYILFFKDLMKSKNFNLKLFLSPNCFLQDFNYSSWGDGPDLNKIQDSLQSFN